MANLGVPTASSQELPDVAQLSRQSELPNPLTLFDGSPVQTAEAWRTARRPELLRLFARYMYGVAPAPPKLTYRISQPAVDIEGGTMRLKQVDIYYAKESVGSPIHLALFMPTTPGPHPVFLALNACGNHRVVDDPAVAIYTAGGGPCGLSERGAEKDFWCARYLTNRGYVLATFDQSDIDPDEPNFEDGVHHLYGDFAKPIESQWGTIAAWAWGLSRAMDYLATDPEIDARRVAVTGHSRRGKTALWAGANDERFACVIPHQSGTGGTALSRGNDQETVERINRAFPHWFNDAFVKFGDNEDQLPFDQHCLIALVAPRPLLETAGDEDLWANYNSSLNALRAADPVYKLNGAKGLVGEGVWREGEPASVDRGNLLQYRQNDKHTWNERYWRAMLDFTDVWMPAGK